MQLYWVVLFSGLLGLIMGSFVNVIALRYGVRTLRGRSKCSKCNTTLHWYELVPLVSYIIQWGRCRHCHCRISPRYPLIEFATGAAFALHTAVAFTNTFLWVFGLVSICLCAILALYDMQSQFLPSRVLYWLVGVGLITYITSIFSGTVPFAMIDLLFLCIPAGFLFVMTLISRGKWMGLGDGILFLGLSLLLGNYLLALYALILSCWVGAICGAAYILYQKYTAKRPVSHMIPFGPFLIVGSYVIWWFSLAGVLFA